MGRQVAAAATASRRTGVTRRVTGQACRPTRVRAFVVAGLDLVSGIVSFRLGSRAIGGIPPEWNNGNVDDVECQIIVRASARVEFVRVLVAVAVVAISVLLVIVVQVNGEEKHLAGIVTPANDFFCPIPVVYVNVYNRALVAQ